MMVKEVIDRINIGRGIFGQDIFIPVIKIGEGKPILTLISGIHGDEVSGLFILLSFISFLRTQLQQLKGTIYIIPSANPLAQLSNSHVWITDPKDLNRIIPGDKDGSLTERIAFKVFNFIRSSDCVIDFHTDNEAIVPYGIFLATGSEDVQKKSLEYICAYSPKYIWVIKPKEDIKYLRALGPQLCMEGIANFAVELPQSHRLRDELIEKQIKGINNVMIAMGMIEGKIEIGHECPVIGYRRCKKADEGGLFLPQIEAETGRQIRKGDVIGKIISIHDFKSESVIRLEYSGELIAIREKDLVSVGDDLCCLIESIPELQKTVREIRSKMV